MAHPLAYGGSVARAAQLARGRDLGLQTLLAAFLLVLLWQPAITVAELKPQQNIIAVLVDSSRSTAARAQKPSRSPPRLLAGEENNANNT